MQRLMRPGKTPGALVFSGTEAGAYPAAPMLPLLEVAER